MHNGIRTIPLFFEAMSFFPRLPRTRMRSPRRWPCRLFFLGLLLGLWGSVIVPKAQALPPSDQENSPEHGLNLEPSVLENSPVLQRWIEEIPDVLSDIDHDPSFQSRLRMGYRQNWSGGDGSVIVGIEDIFLGGTGLTVSGNYEAEIGHQDGDAQEQYGLDMQYYLLPLGSRVNVAPVVGYRQVDLGQDDVEGANVGMRLRWNPSRSGAADLSLTQTWVDPGGNHPLSRFTLSVGYALTQDLRLSTDLQVQTSDSQSQTDAGLVLEWLL